METLIAVAIVLVVFWLVLLATSWITVGKEEYMVINWKIPFLLGPKEGHFIAIGLRQGLHAKVYTAGLKFIPFVRTPLAEPIKKPLVVIPEGKYGVVIAKDGRKSPVGKRFISEKIVHCDNYSDGEKFLRNGGQRGIQISPPLPPGKYAINEFIFEVKPVDPLLIASVEKMIKIGDNERKLFVPQVGLVTLNVGEEIPNEDRKKGRNLGRIVEGHRGFQDLANFMPLQENEESNDELNVEQNEVNKQKTTNEEKKQKNTLERGPQIEVLPLGAYVHIPEAVEVKLVEVPFIDEGQVGVIISSVGEIPSDEQVEHINIPLRENVQEAAKNVGNDSLPSVGYILKDKFNDICRGIRSDYINPGFYPTVLPTLMLTQS